MSKYVATLMERVFIKADSYIFLTRNVLVGDYDEENDIFIDNNGKEYCSMMSVESLTTDIPYSFYHLERLSNLKNVLKINDKLSRLISEYEDYCQSIAYYIGYTDDYVPFLYAINSEKLRDDAIAIKNNGSETSKMTTNLGQLMIDAIDGKFSKTDLENMIDKFKTIQDDLENTIGTLETKIEAIDNNQTFSECLRAKLDTPKEVQIKPTVKKVSKLKEETKVEEEVKEEKQEVKQYNKKIDIESLFNKVTKTLIAQDEPTRRVITELARKELDDRKKREGILLTGPTGVGKTELMRLISKYTDKVLHIINSTSLTVPGYTGKDIEEELWDLYVKCNNDKEKAEHAIIYFDEIDKKGSEKKNDVSGEGVLNVLLPFIEGSTYTATKDTKNSASSVQINTSNMTVILGGAYTDVYKNLLEKNVIGFDHDKSSTKRYRKAETKDFVENGLMTNEFMGRVVVIELNPLDVEDLKRVMLEGDESAINIQKEIFEKIGVKIKFTDSYINKVAQMAYDKETGARGLNGIIDESTWKAFDEVYTNIGLYDEVIFNEETVEDNTKYQLIKKKNKK